MSDLPMRITMTATAEVRDADGNLKDTFPITIERDLTPEEQASLADYAATHPDTTTTEE